MKSYNFSQMEKKYHFYVHRLVAHDFLENPDNKQLVDHIDGNRQNNQVTNLRYATISENNRNRLKSIKSTTSRYKGVYWSKENSKWRARIEVNGKKIHLGYFDNEKEGAEAYNNAAIELFGEFANLNIIEDDH